MGKMQKAKLAPDVSKEMLAAKFWLNNEDKRIIMNPAEIKAFNQATYQRAKRFGQEELFLNLEDYPEFLSIKSIKKIMDIEYKPAELEQKSYFDRHGKELSGAQKKMIIENLNQADLEDEVRADRKVKFAVLIKRSSIKKYPTDIFLAADQISTDLDRNQLTALSVGTPCAVLAESRDQNWLFIQAKLYKGWVKKENTAFAQSKKEALSYLKSDRFLVVAESRVETEPNPFAGDISNVLFQMGDKIPLLKNEEIPDSLPENNPQAQSAEGCYAVWLPTRSEAGNLEYKKALLARSNDLNEGFLPYTRENIIKEAFKLLGERYGWGGLFNRRDCSRFIMDIYRTVGIGLPRDSGAAQQKIAAGKIIEIRGDIKTRKSILNKLQAGDPLYMKGHAVMYLGERNGEHYLIHSASGYSRETETANIPVTVHGVFVMKAEQLLKNGERTYLESFSLARKFYI
ncbi:MAG: SH3 domain-containing protein [Halanaerobium sp.]